MKRTAPLDERKNALTRLLSSLPRKILSVHGRDNIAEFVLHELGKPASFDLKRAAYIIDNPDFNCLRGVAGFYKPEVYTHEDIWSDPNAFSKHMYQATYNNKVRCYQRESCVKKGATDEEIVQAIARDLELDKPLYYAWNMKHDNHGILLYEKDNDIECDCDYLLEGLCLIGFCPVF